MFSLWTRARAGLNLTPGQRAVLKLAEGLFWAALVAALPVVVQLLTTMDPARLDWPVFARQALAVFLLAGLLAFVKYVKAHLDAPLAPATVEALGAAAAARLRAWGGVPNDVVVEPDLPPDPPPDPLPDPLPDPGDSTTPSPAALSPAALPATLPDEPVPPAPPAPPAPPPPAGDTTVP